MTLNLKCPCCGYTETVHDERSAWLVCPKCQTVVEQQISKKHGKSML